MSELLNDGFDQPTEISDARLSFPATVRDIMPIWEEIPVEFRSYRGNDWTTFVSEWFFRGWPERGLWPKEGVDSEKAFRHAYTILRSFEPKHEHKEAAVAWLLSRWYDRVGEDANGN